MTDQNADLVRLEKTLAELEQIVERIESGELPLDEALKLFEKGIGLTKHCQEVLRQAEQKVEILLAGDEEPSPLDTD